MDSFERLKALVQNAEADVLKAQSGNKAAGTRVRKHMQEIKKAAQEVRASVLEMRSEPEAGETQPSQPQQ